MMENTPTTHLENQVRTLYDDPQSIDIGTIFTGVDILFPSPKHLMMFTHFLTQEVAAHYRAMLGTAIIEKINPEAMKAIYQAGQSGLNEAIALMQELDKDDFMPKAPDSLGAMPWHEDH